MQGSKEEYKSTLKATSLFGGNQVFSIVMGILRSKMVAVLLGPEGMGFSGLFTATTGLISSFTTFNLGTSAVRDIAEANGTNDSRRIGVVIGVFRKLVIFTGLLGMLICALFAPYWSYATFSNYDYSWAFVLLAFTLLFGQISAGQTALLQGMRRYSYMVKSGMIGNVLGLIISIPLYYLYGIDAVIWVMVIASVTSLALSFYYSRKVKIEHVDVTVKDIKREGSKMFKLGVAMSAGGIIGSCVTYLVRIFIANYGELSDVGLYAAGFTIVNTYVGLVFSAMGADYYPRLASISKDNNLMSKAMNQQMEISLLILGPIIAAFIIFIHFVTILMYSERFIPVEGMMYWAVFALFFKAVSWAISFIFLAKADVTLYFWSETFANAYVLLFNIGGYYFWGLTGMGISFFVTYLVYLLQVWIVAKNKYGLKIDSSIFKIFLPQFLISACAIFLVVYCTDIYRYSIGIVLILLSMYLSYIELNKRIDLNGFIKQKLCRDAK